MPYHIAGIDVHKKMLAVAVADVAVEGDFHFERLKVGTSPVQLRALADWLVEREVDEVVMESTAQYWRPVWEALERYWRPTRRTRADASPVSGTLHLAQAQSNRAAGGRKRDFPGRGTSGEALGRAGTDPQFCARRRAAALADRDAPQVPDHAQPRATPQPAGVAPRGSPHQDIECGVRSAGHQCASYAARCRRRRNGSGGAGRTGGLTLAGDARSIARRLRCVRGSSSSVSAAGEADARRIAA